MTPIDRVKASVYDIRKGTPLPDALFCDTNILYWVFYPSFGTLQLAGGATPSVNQAKEYPKWIKWVMKSGKNLCVCNGTIAEIVKTMEYAELETLWVTDPSHSSNDRFDARRFKSARYQYLNMLESVRKRICTHLASLRKHVRVMADPRSPETAVDTYLVDWSVCAGDFPDSVAVSIAKQHGIPQIVTDDQDFLTMEGVIVYTANVQAIADATRAGKMLN